MPRPLIRFQTVSGDDACPEDKIIYYRVSKKLALYLCQRENQSSRDVIKHASVKDIYWIKNKLGRVFISVN